MLYNDVENYEAIIRKLTTYRRPIGDGNDLTSRNGKLWTEARGDSNPSHILKHDIRSE